MKLPPEMPVLMCALVLGLLVNPVSPKHLGKESRGDGGDTGPTPSSLLVFDDFSDNQRCGNPSHLEPVAHCAHGSIGTLECHPV